MDASRLAHITPLLCELHCVILLLGLIKKLVLTFKAIHGMGSDCLRDRLFLITSPHPVWSSRRDILQVLSAKKLCLVGPKREAFSTIVSSLWNYTPPRSRFIILLIKFLCHLSLLQDASERLINVIPEVFLKSPGIMFL